MNYDSIVRVSYVVFRTLRWTAAVATTIERHITGKATLGDIQKLGLPVFDPLRPRQTLAFGAVSIAAAIERVPFVAALITAFEVAAENCCTAHLDGRHDAPLPH